MSASFHYLIFIDKRMLLPLLLHINLNRNFPTINSNIYLKKNFINLYYSIFIGVEFHDFSLLHISSMVNLGKYIHKRQAIQYLEMLTGPCLTNVIRLLNSHCMGSTCLFVHRFTRLTGVL